MGIKNPLGVLNTVTTLLSADGVVRFGESLLTNVANNLTTSLGRSLGAHDAFAGQRIEVNEQLNPNIRAFAAAEGPNEILTERLDPLSSNTLSSEAFQPTNFNGTPPPALDQENLIAPAVQNLNFRGSNIEGRAAQLGPFSSTNTLGSGADTQPFTRTDIIGNGADTQPLKAEKILPAAFRPTNNDGVNPPALTKFNTLGGGGPPGPALTAVNIFP